MKFKLFKLLSLTLTICLDILWGIFISFKHYFTEGSIATFSVK